MSAPIWWRISARGLLADRRIFLEAARAATLFLLAAGASMTVAAPVERARSDSSLGEPAVDPYASTYEPLTSVTTAIVDATILTATGPRIEHGTLLMAAGKIVAVGTRVALPPGAHSINGRGKWVTPGLIDPHTHVGVGVTVIPHMDNANEMTDSNTAELWVEHSVWPQDPAFVRALSGGVTTLQILPGSGNLFNGRTVVVKDIPNVSVTAMKFPGAPQGLKMACGENPIKVHGGKGNAPMTLMANVAGYREGWIAARDYAESWRVYREALSRGTRPEPPKRDLKLETLARALEGKIPINIHCYRADEMVQMINISHEFGFHVASFHHAVEAYKIAPLLAKEHICAVVWSQYSAAKSEMYDAIAANAALLERAGVCVAMHSDFVNLGEHLNLEAAISIGAGNQVGLGITDEEAIRWITLNPARLLGVAAQTGSLEPGKMADAVLWNGDPFSSFSVPEKVYVDGALAYDRDDPLHRPRTDFELGQTAEEGR